jgi:hypothetical protein
MYNPYYQTFPHHAVSTDYESAARYNTNYGLISYDSSYINYPTNSVIPSATSSFNYMNNHYPSNQ